MNINYAYFIYCLIFSRRKNTEFNADWITLNGLFYNISK